MEERHRLLAAYAVAAAGWDSEPKTSCKQSPKMFTALSISSGLTFSAGRNLMVSRAPAHPSLALRSGQTLMIRRNIYAKHKCITHRCD